MGSTPTTPGKYKTPNGDIQKPAHQQSPSNIDLGQYLIEASEWEPKRAKIENNGSGISQNKGEGNASELQQQQLQSSQQLQQTQQLQQQQQQQQQQQYQQQQEQEQEQEIKNQQIKDQEIKDQQLKDQQIKDQQKKDQEIRDQQIKEEERCFRTMIEGTAPIFNFSQPENILDKLPQQFKEIYNTYEKYQPPDETIQFDLEMPLYPLEDECYYQGKMVDHKKQGFGYYLTQNEFYEGYFQDDERKGWGRVINYQGYLSGQWDNGTVQKEMDVKQKNYSYKGQCKGSSPHGYGKLEKPEFIYEGNFEEGKKQGKGTQELKFTNEKYEGEFFEDKYHGKGTYYYQNGKRYTGNFKNNKPEGKGEMFWPSPEEKYYKGDFVNAQREGKGYFRNNDNSEYEGDWKNDKQHGFGKYTKDKIEVFGKWKDGIFLEDEQQ